LAEEANAGERGGAPGDRSSSSKKKQHAELHRDGLNVAYELHITFTDAIFGLNAECLPSTEKQKLNIPPGTQSGKYPAERKRIPAVNSYEKETSLIHVNVWTPQHVSAVRKSHAGKIERFTELQPQPDKNERSFFDKVREMFS